MSKEPRIRVLVADDHKLFRAGLVRLMRDRTNIFVVDEAEDGQELIKKFYDTQTDVILTDIAMPKITGLQAVTKLKKDNKDIKALFLTMYDSEEYIYQVLKAGGTGLINKNVLEGELEYAIECVYSGKQYFGNKWTDEKLADLINEYDKHSRLIKSETTKLTYREEQVLKFIKNGNTSAQIAEKLGIAKKTVDFHRSLIMQKCNLNSSNALIIFAVKYFEE